jgi:hypothetical protein
MNRPQFLIGTLTILIIASKPNGDSMIDVSTGSVRKVKYVCMYVCMNLFQIDVAGAFTIIFYKFLKQYIITEMSSINVIYY